MTLRIDPEIKALCPSLSEEERRLLEESLLTEGCREPLVIWQGILLDGHNRYEICGQHNLSYEVQEVSGIDSREDAKLWVLKNQLGRRNLNPDQASILRGELYNREKKAGSGRADRDLSGGKNYHPKTAERLAGKYGVSEKTIRNDGKIAEYLDERPEDKQAVLSGEKRLTEVRRDRKKKKLEEEKKRQAQQVKDDPNPPIIELGDYGAWLEKQSQCDLLLTDPPYSTDVDDIQKFAASWLPKALTKVKSTGRAYVFIGAYPEEIQAYLNVRMPDQILVWTYRNTLGPSPKDKYKLNWQAILYYKMSEAPVLDCPVMTEQFSVQDINAPDGRQFNRYHSWQKPDLIAERFVRHATKEGDTVLDPFAGTGTFVLAASRLGRKGCGCDNSSEMLEIAEQRGCKCITTG